MEQIQRTQPHLMATVSLALGIFAMLSLFNVYYAVFLGCMSILFACLSRGSGFKMPTRAVSGFGISVFAMLSSILLTAFSVYLMVEMFGMETVMDPEALQEAMMDLYTKLLEEMQTTGGSPL